MARPCTWAPAHTLDDSSSVTLPWDEVFSFSRAQVASSGIQDSLGLSSPVSPPVTCLLSFRHAQVIYTIHPSSLQQDDKKAWLIDAVLIIHLYVLVHWCTIKIEKMVLLEQEITDWVPGSVHYSVRGELQSQVMFRLKSFKTSAVCWPENRTESRGACSLEVCFPTRLAGGNILWFTHHYPAHTVSHSHFTLLPLWRQALPTWAPVELNYRAQCFFFLSFFIIDYLDISSGKTSEWSRHTVTANDKWKLSLVKSL